MKGSKFLAMCAVLAMIMSAFVGLNMALPMAQTGMWLDSGFTPGYNHWGNATNDKLELVYNDGSEEGIELSINTTGLEANTNYYLYPPIYNNTCSGATPEGFEWGSKYYNEATWSIKTHITDPTHKLETCNVKVVFGRAGMWLIDKDDTHDQDDPTSFGSFVWVNSSIDYITTAPNDFAYGTNGTKTVSVNVGDTGDTHLWVDLLYNDAIVTNDQSKRFHRLATATSMGIGLYGNITVGSGTGVGNYSVRVYKDKDIKEIPWGTPCGSGQDRYEYGGTFGWGWNTTHNFSAVTGYNRVICGPWDPPERNATDEKFRVTTGTLDASIPKEANRTQYWNFDGEIDIQVLDTDGDPIDMTAATTYWRIVNRHGHDIGNCIGWSNISEDSNGWLNITSSSWGRNSSGYDYGLNGTTSTNANGTWRVYVWTDINGDANVDSDREWWEEWNATVTFKIQKAPGSQFKWIDDDGDVWNDADNDGVIPKIPSVADVPLYVQFQVIGDDHFYYGDTQSGETVTQAMENITVSGDALFTGSLDTIPGVDFNADIHPAYGLADTWTVPIIPTMSQGGGTITISASWSTTSKNYGTVKGTLSIGGTNYVTNGTMVSITPSEFEIGTDQTFTITVKDADDNSYNYADIYLYYISDGSGASEPGDVFSGHMLAHDWYSDDRAYTLSLNTSQQRNNQTGEGITGSGAGFNAIKAPRNFTVYVEASNAGYGYARISMNAQSSLYVNAEASASAPTSTVMAGFEYDQFWVNTTIISDVENTTKYPDEDDESNLNIRIFDENGNDVTNDLGTRFSNFATELSGDYTQKSTNVYFTEAGTYKVYAYNSTANSKEHNGTLIVQPVVVTCDKTPFIWKSDDNISATFTVTYDGEPVTSGVLVVDNISWTAAKYNRTFTNCSFDGSTDQAGNTSWELSESEGFVDGVVTMHDITADFLPANVALMNISFWYKPENDGVLSDVFARTEGVVEVSVPTVTPNKKYVSVGRTTLITIEVTGREDAKLSDVFVRLYGQGIDQNGTSDSDGIVTFSILPNAAGNISIDVGEAGRRVTTKIVVTSWMLDISTDPVSQVDEEGAFTVTAVKDGTAIPVEGADVKFNGVTYTTDATGKASITAPAVTSDRTYTITVSAEGYGPDPDGLTITVINIPSLTIIPPSKKIYGKEEFTITVAEDTGQAVIGAAVTFNGEIYYTGAGGSITLTAPDVKEKSKNFVISATFTGFTEAATKEITIFKAEDTPGFELLTLIAAIGVAFILMRRRRR